MRKLVAIMPTWLLAGALVFGFVVSTSQQKAGHNWIAFSTLGLSCYPIVAIFIAGMVKTVRGEQGYSLGEKWFYGYLLGVWSVTVIGAIYFMAHN